MLSRRPAGYSMQLTNVPDAARFRGNPLHPPQRLTRLRRVLVGKSPQLGPRRIAAFVRLNARASLAD